MAVVEIEGVSKHFGSLAALNDVSFQVEEGELFGIAGPNGAGKSVLFSVISGFYRPTSGSVLFDGRSIVGLGPHEICHRGLTRTFQIPATFHSLSVRENVLAGGLFGARRADRVPEILRFLDLDGVANAKATNLDLHTTKKVVLGAALATGCRVLMLDEPMAGFSHVEIESFLGLVRRINQEWGITIMIIEHLLDVLIGVTDRMMILHYGEVLYCGPPDEVKSDERVVDVYLGGGTEA
jgi:branched-chain amino acid transport system ATP-binding protein